MDIEDDHQLLFLDCEFSSLDIQFPDLISLSLVSQKGDTFYAELPEYHWRETASRFVIENVVPLLEGEGKCVSLSQFKKQLHKWISHKSACAIVSDAPEYDFELLRDLMQETWPENLHKLPLRFDPFLLPENIRDDVENARQLYFETNPPHHARNDAEALKVAWEVACALGWTPNTVYKDNWDDFFSGLRLDSGKMAGKNGN